MGLMSNLKKILFDEVDVEIPVRSDEIPNAEHKKNNTGFVDHTTNNQIQNFQEFKKVDTEEEDSIKEVIVPKEEPERKVNEYSFPIINDYDIPVETRTRSKQPIVEEEVKKTIQPRRDYRTLINNMNEKEHHKVVEERDYHKLLESKRDVNTREKKPFTVTPVISPVYGIIEETAEMSREYITIPKQDVVKKEYANEQPRTYGPVSYNEPKVQVKTTILTPNVEPTKYTKIVEEHHKTVEVKEEPVPTSINNYMDKLDDTLEKLYPSEPVKTYDDIEMPASKMDDEIISSPDYDSLDAITSGIENEYIGNNNIEDEINNENELNDEIDSYKIESETVKKTDDIINEVKKNDYNDEDAHLDDTIETDLFNLIDSMYKDDDDEVEE